MLFRRLHEKLDQIDDTIQRNTDAFDRHGAAFDRLNAGFDRLNEGFDRLDTAFDDLQVVIRENRLLQQRSLEHLEAFVEQINADAEARMGAVRRMLDRWGEGPTPAS